MKQALKKLFFCIEKFFLQFKRKKDILFVIENEIMLGYAYPLYEQLRGDAHLRLWFCTVSGKHFRDLDKVKKEYSIKTVSYRIAKRLKWDLIIFPDHGPYFRVDCPKIFIGHGLGSGKKVHGEEYVFGPRSLDENGRIIYEKILRASEFVKEKIKVHYPEFLQAIRVVGSLVADQISEYTIDKEKKLEDLGLDPSKKTVLFVSSWGPASLIQDQGIELVKRIPSLTNDYNVIISAHLNNYTNVHYKGIDLEELFHTIQDDNVYVAGPEEAGHFILLLADLLVADMTSLGLYFPPFNCPIIFYDNPSVEYNPIALILELKKTAYVINNVSAIAEDISEAFKQFNPSKMEELADKVSSYRGRAKERYTQEIYESLHLEKWNCEYAKS